MVLRAPHDELAFNFLFLGCGDPDSKKEVREDNHGSAKGKKVMVGKQLAALDCPKNEQRRNAAEHHQQTRNLQALRITSHCYTRKV